MVKLQNQRVALAAVRARVFEQVVQQQSGVSLAHRDVVQTNALDVLFAVLLVPLLLVVSPVGPTKVIVAAAPRRILIKLGKIDIGLTANTVFSLHAAILITAGAQVNEQAVKGPCSTN